MLASTIKTVGLDPEQLIKKIVIPYRYLVKQGKQNFQFKMYTLYGNRCAWIIYWMKFLKN